MKNTIKKISLLFATVLMIALFAVSASAASEGYYTYTITDGEATITDVDTSISGDITIPATLGGYSVTTIGEWAFYSCESLTSVTIPDSVTTIGARAFYSCDSLASVTIPDSVTTIGVLAFEDCDSLTSVTIPDSVTTIGELAFYSCDSLTSIVVDINNSAYSNDSRGVLFNKNKTMLIHYPRGNTGTSYTIPDSVATIGPHAFYNCYSLTSVTIPDSVTTIGDYAFVGCNNLTSIVVDINNSAYSNDSRGVLFNKKKTILIQYPAGNTGTSYTIPDSVTTIGEWAFYSCDSLTSVTIPDSVTTIGDYAFRDCDRLTSVTIPDSVTTIGDDAFYDCFRLTSVTIPDSVTTIGEGAFASCDSLTDVYYKGTEEQWNDISIGLYNDDLLNATIHYNRNHTYTSEITRPATHLSEGVRTYTCGTCGDSYTEAIAKTKEHSYNTVSKIVAPTCEKEGYTVYICECGHTYNGDKKASTGHNYNGDTCVDCGESKTENCSCNCHKSGISGFFWKILRFFYKLFGTNKTCGCGVAHY